MRYARLAPALLPVSRIGLGGNVFGHFLDEAGSANLIHRAGEFGINLIDTADTYSDGLSETCIGKAIRGRREQWLIASKVGVRSHQSPAGLGSRQTIRSRIEGSLERLGTDYIDLYQTHHYDAQTPLEETVASLSELVTAGKIRCFGVSNYTAAYIRSCIDLSQELGLSKVGSVQTHFNLLKRSIQDDLLPLCSKANVGVLAFGVLARGVLAGKYRPGKPVPQESRAALSASIRADLVPEVLDVVEALGGCAHRFAMPLSRMCIAWALAQPGITSVLLGVRSAAQLAEDVLAADIALNDECQREIDGIVCPAERFRDIKLGQQVMY